MTSKEQVSTKSESRCVYESWRLQTKPLMEHKFALLVLLLSITISDILPAPVMAKTDIVTTCQSSPRDRRLGG